MAALNLFPRDNNYLTCRLIYDQLTANSKNLTLAEDISAGLNKPKVLMDGAGRAFLQGSLVIDDNSPTTDMHIFTLPKGLMPLVDSVFPVAVLRAGAYIANAIKINAGGAPIASVVVNEPGSYETLPTLVLSGPGSGATLSSVMQAVSWTVASAGTGYEPADTVTLAGGTSTEAAVVTVSNVKLISLAVNAAGTGYQIGDTITLAGGTASTPAIITVDTVGGSGEVQTFSITTAGVYTATTSSFTQASTSGTGTGATFNTAVFGINAGTVSTAGSYTVLPTNPVSQSATSGTGTGATFNVLWGILSVTVSSGGTGFTEDSQLLTSGGNEVTPAEFTLNLGASTAGVVTLINQPTQDDVVYLDSVAFIVASYNFGG